jgi:protein-S-isoprenylcysteine O-methyltransferase Ste14
MRSLLVVLLFEAVLAGTLFGAAGRVDLPWFWALLGVHTALMAVGLTTMDQGLRRERMRPGPGGIDRGFRPLLAVLLLIHLLVAALDAGRFGGSPPPPVAVRAAALGVYAAGVILALRAMAVNRFFSPVVRLQTERGHRTVTSGPYRLVRHPGYLGMLAAVLAECYVFGSLWSVLPAMAFAAVVLRRTALEDRFLRARLGGYADYATGVRYRLVPCVW